MLQEPVRQRTLGFPHVRIGRGVRVEADFDYVDLPPWNFAQILDRNTLVAEFLAPVPNAGQTDAINPFLGSLLRLDRSFRDNQADVILAPLLAEQSVLHGAWHVDAIQALDWIFIFALPLLAIPLLHARVIRLVDEAHCLPSGRRKNRKGDAGRFHALGKTAEVLL